MSDRIRHPIFARLYPYIGRAAEASGAAEHRATTLSGLRGRVVEIGAGSGLNFGHYPDTVTEVIAVEPEPHLRSVAEQASREADVSVTVVDGSAERIPLEDASVDAGVAFLVLCSVRDPAAALAELHRVIRPGGELRFYEHVAAGDPGWRRRQRRVDPIWTRIAGGCHITRDTEDAITAAGFEIEHCERFLFAPTPWMRLGAPHIMGSARR